MSGDAAAYGRECTHRRTPDGPACEWPAGQVTHGPVEPGCPDSGAHHEYAPRWPIFRQNPAQGAPA
jgi:hypothetical protein